MALATIEIRAVPSEVVRAVVDLGAARPDLLRDPERLAEDPPRSDAALDFARDVREGPVAARGFAVVDGTAIPGAYRRFAYALLGVSMAPPILRYGLLYAVEDRGGSHVEAAIPISMTRASTGMHTDSSARDCVPGIIALLCERPSLDGGTSRLSDAAAACRWLAEHDPGAMALLREAYVRDVVTPGMDRGLDTLRRNRFPIVEFEPSFRIRYMRYWIETGQGKAGAPLGADVLLALDALDAALAREEWSTSFRLEPGQMLFVDNQRIVHGRDAYNAVPAGGRLLWRMWLDERYDPRPAPDAPLAKPTEVLRG